MRLSYICGTSSCSYYISDKDAHNLHLSIEKALFLAGFPERKKEPVRILHPTKSSIGYRVYPTEYRVSRISTLLERRETAVLSIPSIKRSMKTYTHL